MHRVSNWRDNLIVVGSKSGTLYRLETQPSFAPARILKFSLPLLTLFFPLFSSFSSSFFFFFPFLFFLLHSMYNVEDEQNIYICILFFFSKKSYHRTSDRISIHDARITCNEVNVRGGEQGKSMRRTCTSVVRWLVVNSFYLTQTRE